MSIAYANFAELCLLKSIAEWSLAMTVCRALATLDCTNIRALTEGFFYLGNARLSSCLVRSFCFLQESRHVTPGYSPMAFATSQLVLPVFLHDCF